MNRSLSPRSLRSFSRLFLVFVGFVAFSVVVHAQVPAEPTKPAETSTSPTGVTKTPDAATESATESAPSQPQAANPPANPPADPTKFAEALRLRIERARALIAAHRLDIAASELESFRATAQDNAFRNISSIMLMNVYLEEGNYGRAEALLEENFKARSTQKDESLGSYFALAGQAVYTCPTNLARYRTLRIFTAHGNLPAEH